MSIPTRFDVVTTNGIIPNQSIFTFGYTTDLTDRNVWLSRFKEVFNGTYGLEIKLFCPWYDDFTEIRVKEYNHIFSREELCP